jgi:Na+/proline symporter
VPDAVTHLCSGLLAQILGPPGPVRRWAPLFVAGAVLPDLFSRAPSTVLGLVHSHLHPLPSFVLYCWNPLHLPAGILLYSLLLALLFPQAQRRAALAALLAGAAVHVVLDLSQRHVGLGYPLLVPFSSRDFELGLMGSEATVPWAPAVAGVTVALWAAVAWWRREKAPSPRREAGD